MWQHNVWCVCVPSVWKGMVDCVLCGEVCCTAFCVERYVGLQSDLRAAAAAARKLDA